MQALTDREILLQIAGSIDDVAKRVGKLDYAVFGNGKQEDGLIWRVGRLTEVQSWIVRIGFVVVGTIASAAFGLLWLIFTGQVTLNFTP
jgi:hypothetical protein